MSLALFFVEGPAWMDDFAYIHALINLNLYEAFILCPEYLLSCGFLFLL